MCFYLPKFISPPVLQLCVVLLVLPKRNGSFFLQERGMLLCVWGANPWPPSPPHWAAPLPQRSQPFNANTCPDNRSENRPSCMKAVSKRDSGKTWFFSSISVLAVVVLWHMSGGVSSLLNEDRFVKLLVCSFLFIYLVRGIKLEENVGCTTAWYVYLEVFLIWTITCVLAIFNWINFARNWQVQKIQSLAQAISTSTIWKKNSLNVNVLFGLQIQSVIF